MDTFSMFINDRATGFFLPTYDVLLESRKYIIGLQGV